MAISSVLILLFCRYNRVNKPRTHIKMISLAQGIKSNTLITSSLWIHQQRIASSLLQIRSIMFLWLLLKQNSFSLSPRFAINSSKHRLFRRLKLVLYMATFLSWHCHCRLIVFLVWISSCDKSRRTHLILIVTSRLITLSFHHQMHLTNSRIHCANRNHITWISKLLYCIKRNWSWEKRFVQLEQSAFIVNKQIK